MGHPSHSSRPVSSLVRSSFAPSSLSSFIITITVVLFAILFALITTPALMANPPNPSPSISSSALTLPTKSPDKTPEDISSSSSPADVRAESPAIGDKEAKKAGEDCLGQVNPSDQRRASAELVDQRRKDGTNSKSPSPSPTRTNSMLRRSNRRIPERLVQRPPPNDAHILDRMTPPRDDEDGIVGDSVPKLNGKKGNALGIEQQDGGDDDEARGEGHEGEPRQPFVIPHDYTRTLRTASPSDSPEFEDIFPTHEPYPTPIRHLASKSGFSNKMDTISERSAEFEPSIKGNSRPVSMSSTKTTRPASVSSIPEQVAEASPVPDAAPPAVSPPAIAKPDTPQPPTPVPAVIESPSNENLSLEADFRAIGTYMNINTGDLSGRTGSFHGSNRRLLPQGSTQSIDSVLSLSSGTVSTSNSVQDRLRSDLLAARGILSSLQPMLLPDSIIDTSNPFAPFGSGSSSLATVEEERRLSDETTLAAQVSSDSQPDGHKSPPADGGKCDPKIGKQTPPNVPASGESRQPQSHYRSMLDVDKPLPSRTAQGAKSRSPPTTTTQTGPAPTASQKQHPFQLPLIPEVGKGAKLGLDFGVSDDQLENTEDEGKESSRADMADEEDNANNIDTPNPEAAANFVEHGSQAATLTRELMEAINQQSPLVPHIFHFYMEEKIFTRTLVAYSCDSRAKPAAIFIPEHARRTFRRIYNPLVAFGHEIQRYCMKYIAGYDLSHHVRRVQANRDADEWNAYRGMRSSSSHGHRRLLHDRVTDRPRSSGSRSDPRDCGCDTGGNCAHAGSSSGSYSNGGREKKPPQLPLELPDPLLSPFDDGEDEADDLFKDERKIPILMDRPPTPPRYNGRESGFPLGRATMDKGKSVDRTVFNFSEPLPPLDLHGNRPETAIVIEDDQIKPDPSPTKSKKGKSPIYDDCPRLPKLDLPPSSLDSTTPSQTMTTTSTFKSRATTGTPTTPRTHISTPARDAHLPRLPPPPLSPQDNDIIANALEVTTKIIAHLHDFMTELEDTWVASQRSPQEVGLETGESRSRRMQAYMHFHSQLLPNCEPRVVSTNVMLQKQTLRVRGVLDAAELAHKQATGEEPLLPSALARGKYPQLRRTTFWRRDGTMPVDTMMTGGLPHPSPSLGAFDDDDHDEGHRIYPRQLPSNSSLTHRPSGSGSGTNSSPSKSHHRNASRAARNRIRKRHPSPHPGTPVRIHHRRSHSTTSTPRSSKSSSIRRFFKKTPPASAIPHILNAKFSYRCARAELLVLKQMARFKRLDRFTYGSIVWFEERLDRLQEDLLGLDNHTTTTTTTSGSGSGGDGGEDDLLATLSSTRSTGGLSTHRSHDRDDPFTTSPAHIPTNSTPHQRKHSTTTTTPRRIGSSSKSKHAGLLEMRTTANSLVGTIIARRKGRRIGIADTEERVSLDSEGWDWFDSATGTVVAGGSEGSRLGLIPGGGSSLESSGGFVNHRVGCEFGVWGGVDGGVGVGLGVATGGASSFGTENGVGTGSEIGGGVGVGKELMLGEMEPMSGTDGTKCPSCGIDIAARNAYTPAPAPRYGPVSGGRTGVGETSATAGQIGWVRRVMGPRGRKRAGRYFFYAPVFGTPPQSRRSPPASPATVAVVGSGGSGSYQNPHLLYRSQQREKEQQRSLARAQRRQQRGERKRNGNDMIGRTEVQQQPEQQSARLLSGLRQIASNNGTNQEDRERERDQQEREFIARHRRHSESVVRESWAHMEHANEESQSQNHTQIQEEDTHSPTPRPRGRRAGSFVDGDETPTNANFRELAHANVTSNVTDNNGNNNNSDDDDSGVGIVPPSSSNNSGSPSRRQANNTTPATATAISTPHTLRRRGRGPGSRSPVNGNTSTSINTNATTNIGPSHLLPNPSAASNNGAGFTASASSSIYSVHSSRRSHRSASRSAPGSRTSSVRRKQATKGMMLTGRGIANSRGSSRGSASGAPGVCGTVAAGGEHIGENGTGDGDGNVTGSDSGIGSGSGSGEGERESTSMDGDRGRARVRSGEWEGEGEPLLGRIEG